jgi:hypothetical protein
MMVSTEQALRSDYPLTEEVCLDVCHCQNETLLHADWLFYGTCLAFQPVNRQIPLDLAELPGV